ncbi:MAG: hypothetical protein FWC41_08810 [Firmicutes bacterium]|nr:hypothetical protein [Bacillota bacterium]
MNKLYTFKKLTEDLSDEDLKEKCKELMKKEYENYYRKEFDIKNDVPLSVELIPDPNCSGMYSFKVKK